MALTFRSPIETIAVAEYLMNRLRFDAFSFGFLRLRLITDFHRVNRHFRRTGSAGTRTRNQRLKRALLYRLSYRPAPETFSNPDQTPSQDCRAGAAPANRRLGKSRRLPYNFKIVSRSRSEFFGRSNRKIDKPAVLAASQSRLWIVADVKDLVRLSDRLASMRADRFPDPVCPRLSHWR